MFRIVPFAAGLLAAAVLVASGCGDSTGFGFDPVITTDTVELAIPAEGSALPSALDVTAQGGFLGGGRFPERAGEAEQWDVALRRAGGQLVFLPAGAAKLQSPGLAQASITQPLTGRSFEELDEAPAISAFVRDTTVAVQLNGVYVVRSRTPINSNCYQYAKVQPIAVDAGAGTASIRVATNELCQDRRLTEKD